MVSAGSFCIVPINAEYYSDSVAIIPINAKYYSDSVAVIPIMEYIII